MAKQKQKKAMLWKGRFYPPYGDRSLNQPAVIWEEKKARRSIEMVKRTKRRREKFCIRLMLFQGGQWQDLPASGKQDQKSFMIWVSERPLISVRKNKHCSPTFEDCLLFLPFFPRFFVMGFFNSCLYLSFLLSFFISLSLFCRDWFGSTLPLF